GAGRERGGAASGRCVGGGRVPRLEGRDESRRGPAPPGDVVAGAAPVIPVMRPWLGEEEAAAAAAAVTSGWVAQGPRVAEFEKAFATAVGAAHGVAVSSCTAALHLALVATGI